MRASVTVVLLSCVALSACKKKDDAPAAPAPAASSATPPAAPAATASATPADSTDAQRDAAKKQGLMDYGSMEDRYINDASGQWAASATASSTFGEGGGNQPSPSSLAKNVVGAVDGNEWTNNNQDIGFDWLETTYAKPVNATEVRVVFKSGDGVEAVSKIELQDTNGTWNSVWSGISDVKADSRGSRTWFVKTFPQTTYQAKAVKVTIANNLQRGYKVIDAVQLVGK